MTSGAVQNARTALRTLSGESPAAMRARILEIAGSVVPCDLLMSYGLADLGDGLHYTQVSLRSSDDTAHGCYAANENLARFPKGWNPASPPARERNRFVVMTPTELDRYPQWHSHYAPFGECAAHMLLAPCGRLRHADARLADWLDARRIERLRELVRGGASAGPRTPACVLDGVELSASRLDGPDGVAWLVTARRAAIPHMHRDAMLSPRQREVASYAAAGATVAEIAAQLGISPNTVKHTLKRVYRELGVASRLELAETLGRSS